MEQEPVLGIDLGTSTSCVAVVEGGRPVVIPNRGNLTTPSVVAFTATGETLVGHAAKKQAIMNAENTVVALKRLIGRRWDSPEARSSLPHATLVEGPNGDVRIRIRDRVYALAQLNALILRDLKVAAEAHLNRTVSKAVITVPAYFNDGQRQATHDAGTIAGLEVVRMINEPTAAAVAYGFGRGKEKTIVVYDLGGGTFDISIVRLLPDGTFEVLGTGGDTFLGGEDFDRRVQEWLSAGFRKAQNVELPQDRTTLQRLKEAAETAKCALSERESCDVEIPFIMKGAGGEPLHLRAQLTRKTFDELSNSLVGRTIDLTRQALAEAKCAIAGIDDLVLVGGSSRIPAVHRAVTELLGRKPSQGVHPDEAVAIGAALHGHAVSAAGKPAVMLLDVTPYTLGIRLRNNFREAVIPKNTRIPTKCTRNFRTTRDSQTHVDIVLLQGESEAADANVLLGQFRLDKLRPAPAATVSIDVTVSIDSSGVVQVTATDVGSGRAQSIKAVASSGLTPSEIAAMKAGANAEAAVPQETALSLPVASPSANAPPKSLPLAEENPAAAGIDSLPPLPVDPATAAPTSLSPVSRDAKPGGFRLQLEDVIASLELVCGRAMIVLSSSDFGRSLLADSQVAIQRAREAAAGGRESAMRDCAFELAVIQQKLAGLVG